MKDQSSPNSPVQSPVQKRRDVPHSIKWVLLIFLLILLFLELFSGEYGRLFTHKSPLIWLVLSVKLLLILLIILLMRVQRSLKCAITAPDGCTEEKPDTVNGLLFITVRGTASGGAFGYYTVDIQKDGGAPYAGIVTYPGGGSSGGSPVVNGDLANINTTALSDGEYTITLRVYPVGNGPVKVCSITFNLLKVAVWINSVEDVVPDPNIFDENATLRDVSGELSFGGSLNILGSAYIYECDDRKVQQVEMRYARLPFGAAIPSQPASNTAIPAAWPSTQLLAPPLVYDPSKYYPWTRIGMAPTGLLNTWGTCNIPPIYPRLIPQRWYSRNATGGAADGGGYFKLLLITQDTSASVYYDSQLVWVDNHQVQAQLVKFQRFTDNGWEDLPSCTDLLMSWGRLRIIGIAWDALIDHTYPATRPNDNFNRYGITYAKQFVPGPISITIPPIQATQRVPSPLTFPLNTGSVPGGADADVLVEWDLAELDAGTSPLPGCSNPPAPHELYRGCECTYTITLHVSDFTLGTEPGVHSTYDIEAVKIINDL